MYVIEVVWNTDHNNRWIADSTGANWSTLPRCLYGPFGTEAEADWHLFNLMDDKDMNDAFYRLMTPEDEPHLNSPTDTLWFYLRDESPHPITFYTAGIEVPV